MATSTSTAKKKQVSNAANEAKRQVFRETIKSLLATHFSGTLNTQDDMVKIFLSLMLLESSWNVDVRGKSIPVRISSGARDYWNSNAVKKILETGTATQISNVTEGLRAMGLSQTMGWNHVKGASATGKCEIERIRPDLAGQLCVAPGDDIAAILVGEKNISNNILAGLAILESKWKACKAVPGGWKIGSRVFPLRISASVAGYLGLGKADVVTGKTPEDYSASIVGGDMYAKANGDTSPQIRDSKVQYATTTTQGPVMTVASAKPNGPAGCSA